ncbi:MAG: hypothetical protein AAGC60_04950 [Acidobacteriota bacterium]
MTRWITENPFFVLELPVDCRAVDIERQGQKLLGMLELELAAAASYPTPCGPQPRTDEGVRHAMAELREPRRRLVHELWAGAAVPPPESEADSASGWPEAFTATGWLRSS